MNLRSEDFLWVTSEIQRVAQMCCEGRVVSVLEGGYGFYRSNKFNDIVRTSLGESALAHVEGLRHSKLPLTEYVDEKSQKQDAAFFSTYFEEATQESYPYRRRASPERNSKVVKYYMLHGDEHLKSLEEDVTSKSRGDRAKRRDKEKKTQDSNNVKVHWGRYEEFLGMAEEKCEDARESSKFAMLVHALRPLENPQNLKRVVMNIGDLITACEAAVSIVHSIDLELLDMFNTFLPKEIKVANTGMINVNSNAPFVKQQMLQSQATANMSQQQAAHGYYLQYQGQNMQYAGYAHETGAQAQMYPQAYPQAYQQQGEQAILAAQQRQFQLAQLQRQQYHQLQQQYQQQQWMQQQLAQPMQGMSQQQGLNPAMAQQQALNLGMGQQQGLNQGVQGRVQQQPGLQGLNMQGMQAQPPSALSAGLAGGLTGGMPNQLPNMLPQQANLLAQQQGTPSQPNQQQPTPPAP